MPLKPINYNNTIFYRIVCKDLNVKDCYVGSTTNFTKRKQQHKENCLEKSKKYNYRVYQFIINNGGWDNWSMIMIEKISCENHQDVLKLERKFLEDFNATLNMNIPSRTSKEYNEENKEKMKEYHKSYTDKNKDKKKEYDKLYNEENKEKIKVKNKLYNQENKEKINLRQKLYNEENKDEKKEYDKLYNEKNKEKINLRQKLYDEKNKDKKKEYDKIYREKNKEKIKELQKNIYYDKKEKNKDKINILINNINESTQNS
jgi:hypothetical protein